MHYLEGEKLKIAEKHIESAWKSAKSSNCLDAQVGAVIARGSEVVSKGYNYVPEMIDFSSNLSWEYSCGNCPRRIADLHGGVGSDLCYAVHAEQMATTNVRKIAELRGTTIHIAALKDGKRHYNAKPCCTNCAKLIGATGIKDVVLPAQEGRLLEFETDEFYGTSFRNLKTNYRERFNLD